MRIKIQGRELPAYVTMGAMLRYKDLTGKELTEDTGAADMVKYMYCCCQSACRREGVEFGFASVEDFADAVLPKDFQAWAESINEGPEGSESGDSKKK